MRTIVQVANFVAPHSGGIRTVLDNLASGYAGHGHEVVQIVPGPARRTIETPWGRREVLPGRPVPGTGYRLLHPAPVRRLIAGTGADRIEVHDRSTLRGLGRWARGRDVRAVVVSHERLDRVLAQWLPRPLPSTGPLTALADRSNAALAAGYDAVVCTTAWAATEFERLDGVRPQIVPLGVDATRFSPERADPSLRPPDGTALLVLASRLSREKHPELAVRAVGALTARGVQVRLVVAGDGPQRAKLQALADDLPVRLLGFRPQDELARWLASADAVLAPGPVETFCLAALEALASGTPVVANAASAVPEILGPAGVAAPGRPDAFADAVESLLDRPTPDVRAAARAQALRFGWDATVRAMLGVHELSANVAATSPT